MCEIMERYTKEAELEGLKKGREQGLQEGRILAIQNMIEMEIPESKILSKYLKEEYEEAAASMPIEI